MAKEIEDVIQDTAEGPKEAASGDVMVKQHDLGDLIDADRYLKSKDAANTGFGVRRFKVKPPGGL